MSIARLILGMMGAITPAEYLIAGGGGSGGAAVSGSAGRGGGGGAGRLLIGTIALPLGKSWSITIGQGGAARVAGSNSGADGGATTAIDFVAPGGGGGGTPLSGGRDGGSGGGGGSTSGGSTIGGAAVAGTGDAGLGFAGSGGALNQGGAGGGAGGNPTVVGLDASGVESSISGTSVVYCRGATNSFLFGDTPGSGGRGGIGTGTPASDAGQNGIFILRYFGPPRWSGGTVTTSGGYTTHTFTSNGTLAPL